MSSRALRKAQKQRDAALQVAQQEEDDSEDVEELELPSKAKPSAFELLGQVEEDEADEEEVNETTLTENDTADEHLSTDDDTTHSASTRTNTPAKSSGKKKKKKKKGNKKADNVSAQSTQRNSEDEMDEIDKALKALNPGSRNQASTDTVSPVDDALTEVCKLLAIDTASLRVENEMRRLFGKIAFEPEKDETPRNRGPRAGQQDGIPLSEAVTGKYAQGGPGLSAVLRRRNIFMPGKEEWPKVTGGGLTMDIVETRPGGIVEYTYVHNQSYQAAQQEFNACVAMMDPMTMVNQLRFNPYHVSTLLQVSEIAKQDRDPATSGELLERALFSFGRGVHSSFAQNLAAGKARLDFRRPENREFWLAAWRYISNIGMRATWRTAYEWAKLVLSLDPDNDPYCVRLVIDQLAVRGRQLQNFLDLSQSKFFAERWAALPNILFSRALAERMLNPQGQEAAETLTKAIQRFPWVGARLFQDLSIDPVPRSIWGTSATSDLDVLYSELYVSQGLDIWKLPESKKLLTEVGSKLPAEATNASSSVGEISIDEARFAILTDKPALIGLVPRSITSTMESASDPLPPLDTFPSRNNHMMQGRRRNLGMTDRVSPARLVENDPQQFIEELNALQRFFELLIPGFNSPPGESRQRVPGAYVTDEDEEENPRTPGDLSNISEDTVFEAIERTHLSVDEIRACMARFMALRETLLDQPGQRVTSGTDEVVMQANGVVRVSVRSSNEDAFSQALLDDEEAARQLVEDPNQD